MQSEVKGKGRGVKQILFGPTELAKKNPSNRTGRQITLSSWQTGQITLRQRVAGILPNPGNYLTIQPDKTVGNVENENLGKP